jgi:hypothetical protein
MHDSTFKIPNIRHTAKRPIMTAQNSAVPISNKFENLINEQESNKDNDEQPPTNITLKKKAVKHITVLREENYIDLLKKIANNEERKPHARITPQWIHLYPETEDDHRKIHTFIVENKIQGYILPIGTIQPIKVIIRDLPRDFPVDLIRSELAELGFDVLKVVQLSSYIDNSKLKMYQVQLQNTEKNKIIIDLDRLCHIKIRIERYISPFKVQQCHRCQKFHHHSDNCLMEPKCVKCAEKHLSKDCTLPPSKDKNDKTGIKCANCGKNHTANYRRCEKYPKSKILNTPKLNSQSNINSTSTTAGST